MRCPKCNEKMDTNKHRTKRLHYEYYWCPKCHNIINKTKEEKAK